MNEHYPFVNPPLPYPYNALEPFIDEKTMQLHHDRHLQTYVDNLNNAIAKYPEYQNWSLEQLIYFQSELPKEIQETVKNNAGGVYNHIFYFNGMTNSETRANAGKLYSAIVETFGSPSQFFEQFKKQALSVFGSGYAWLVIGEDEKLKIITSANQDTPITRNMFPLLAIDVWEHAYYLKHYNVRADYIDDWFNVINWEYADRLYQKYLESKQ